MTHFSPPPVPDLSLALPRGSHVATPSKDGTIDILDLARELDAVGERTAAQKLVERHVAAASAEAEARRVNVFVPERSMVKSGAAPRTTPHILDVYGKRIPSPTIAKARESAKKAMEESANGPQKTQIRLSQALSSLGAYQGIVDPVMATHATFGILKLASRLPLVQGIINTRVNQAIDTPWRIRLKNKKASITPGARKLIESLTELIQHGGFPREPDVGRRRGEVRRNPRTGEPGVWDGEGYDAGMRFDGFLAHVVRNRLEMGWGCYRIEAGRDEKKYPVAFFRPVASEMIRKTLPARPEWGYEGYTSTFDPPNENVAYMELNPFSLGQVSNGEALREYTWGQLGTVEGYPSVHAFGMSYPYCETEQVLELLGSRADTQRFLSENYNNDHLPLGILSVIGATLGEEGFYEIQAALAKGGGMDAFYRILYLHFLGDEPGAGVQFTPLKSQSGIEAMLQWALQYKTDLRDEILAVYQMNPEEMGQRALDLNGPKLSGSGPDANIAHSKSKGFKPLMRSVASSLTQRIIERFDYDFEFGFDHLNGINEEEDAKVAALWLGAGKTLNEIADAKDEARHFRPVEPVMWDALERDLKRELGDEWEERFGSEHELREAVDLLYEEECKKEGLPCVWSSAWSAPVGSGMGAFQIFQGEQAQNAQYRQQQQQQMQQQAQMQQQQMQGQAGGTEAAPPDGTQSGEVSAPEAAMGQPEESPGQNGPSTEQPESSAQAETPATAPQSDDALAQDALAQDALSQSDEEGRAEEPVNPSQGASLASAGQKSPLFGFKNDEDEDTR